MSYDGNIDDKDYGDSFVGRGDFEQGFREDNIPAFLTTLSPGIQVELQYNDQPPAPGTFQGFENGNLIMTDYDGYPGLVRIASDTVNAVAPFAYGNRISPSIRENRDMIKTKKSVPKLYI